MAPTMRWRMPPDISCGYCLTRVSGDGMRTAFNSSRARLQAAGARLLFVHPDRLGDLVADREQRVQRGHRVLQDHRDPLAADVAHLGVGFLDQILALEQHPAADDPRRRRQHPQDGQRERALAGARLSPTIPSVSPALRRSDTSSTARTTRVPCAET